MSDRNEKTHWQDAAGFALILLGGFGAVSIALFLRGQEPHARVSAFTWPVVELVAQLGSFAALLFSVGLAVLGSLLFLRSSAFSPVRPLVASAVSALGVALILGAFGYGGETGAWLPGLLSGFAGRALGAVLGLALCWLGWTLLFAARSPRLSSAEAVQRLGLSARQEAAAGVSPAEAALLVSEPRSAGTAPSVRREESKPIRVETIRPFNAPRPAQPEAPVKRPELVVPPRVAPVAMSFATPAALPPRAARTAQPLTDEQQLALVTPPAPSWEQDLAPLPSEPSGAFALDDEEDEEDEGDHGDEHGEAGELAHAGAGRAEPSAVLEEELDLGLAVAFELEEEAAEGDAAAEDEAQVRETPAAAWEQVGLFDEQDEEALAEPAPLRPAKVELTPSFDFESDTPTKPAHEPDPSEDPFALEPFLAARAEPRGTPGALDPADEDRHDEEPDVEHVELKPVRAAAPAPKAPAVPAPAVVADSLPASTERPWHQLVFEAGLSILEQKRVAVSMLERRFAIDFDQACRVLDELQEAGLIGPYMGGRTRDILLTREQWLEHAPHAS